MHSESDKVYIDKADYGTLYQNIKDVYHLSLKGKKIYGGWRKVFRTDQAVSKIIQMAMDSREVEDFIHQMRVQYKISKESAEALANMELEELTNLTIDDITNKYNYYSFAVEKLKSLVEYQTK